MKGGEVQGNVVGRVFHMDQVHLGVIAQVGGTIGCHVINRQMVVAAKLGQGAGARLVLAKAHLYRVCGHIGQAHAGQFGTQAREGIKRCEPHCVTGVADRQSGDGQGAHQVGHVGHGHTGHVQAVQVFHLGQGGGACQHLGLAQCHAAAGIAQVDTREFGIATQPGEVGLHIGRRVQHIDAHHLAVAGQGLCCAGPGLAHLQAVAAVGDFGQAAGRGSHLRSSQGQGGGSPVEQADTAARSGHQ